MGITHFSIVMHWKTRNSELSHINWWFCISILLCIRDNHHRRKCGNNWKLSISTMFFIEKHHNSEFSHINYELSICNMFWISNSHYWRRRKNIRELRIFFMQFTWVHNILWWKIKNSFIKCFFRCSSSICYNLRSISKWNIW